MQLGYEQNEELPSDAATSGIGASLASKAPGFCQLGGIRSPRYIESNQTVRRTRRIGIRETKVEGRIGEKVG